jgi:hypothetical protein
MKDRSRRSGSGRRAQGCRQVFTRESWCSGRCLPLKKTAASPGGAPWGRGAGEVRLRRVGCWLLRCGRRKGSGGEGRGGEDGNAEWMGGTASALVASCLMPAAAGARGLRAGVGLWGARGEGDGGFFTVPTEGSFG